tara:strand:- start:583 stop:870 length:288 start_codon:yes stop_codon:yes gene_type:complete
MLLKLSINFIQKLLKMQLEMLLNLNLEVKDLADLKVGGLAVLEEVIIRNLVEEVLAEIGKDLHLIKDLVLEIEVVIPDLEIVVVNRGDLLEVMGV